MIIEELVAKLGLEVDEQAFSRLEASLEGLHKGLLGLAAVAVAAYGAVQATVTAAVEHTAEYADKADEAAMKAGLSTTAIQELGYAARFSSLSIESVSHAMAILSRNAYEAAHGNKDLAAEFGKLGVSAHDLAHAKPEDLFYKISDALTKMPDEDKNKIALAMKAFGKGGSELLPMLSSLKPSVRELALEAHRLGLVLDKETIAAGVEFADDQTRLKASLEGVVLAIGGPLLHQFGKLAVTLTELVVKYRPLIANTIVRAFQAQARAIDWLRKHLYLLELAIGTVATVALGALIRRLVAVTAMEVLFGLAAMSAGIEAAAGFLIAAAPIVGMTLLIAALAAAIFLLGEDLYQFFTGGESALGRYSEQWSKFLDQLYTPRDDDNWLTDMLKGWGRFFADIPGQTAQLVDDWKKIFRDLWTWIVHGFKETVGRIVEALDALSHLQFKRYLANMVEALPNAVGDMAKGTQIGTYNKASGKYEQSTPIGDFVKGNADPDAFYSGGARSPYAAAALARLDYGNKTITDTKSFAPSLTVQAPPGADAHVFGQTIIQQLDQWYDAKMRADYVSVDQ